MGIVGSTSKINRSKIRIGPRLNPIGTKPRKKSLNDLLSRPIRDYDPFNNSETSILINRMMNSGGFEAVNLANGVEILKSMHSDKNCVKFLSFVGAIISTGTRGIIRELIK